MSENGNGHHWSKFFWRDWSADKSLHPCSLAAKGFWIEMLCIMHAGTPVGHLTLNGKPATIRQMAANAYCTEKEAARYIVELEEAGVLSRTDAGTIYCRRMVRDAAASDAGREHAGKRWNNRKPNGSPNGSPSGEATGQPNSNPNAKSTEPEKQRTDSPPVTPLGEGGGVRAGDVGLGTKKERGTFRRLDEAAALAAINGTDGGPTIDGRVVPFDVLGTMLRRIGGGADG